MSVAVDPALRDLDDCGCCAGIEAATPEPIENRAGLPAVAARAGTHSSFLASLLAGLSAGDRPQLRRLSTREPEDGTIALLDAVAAVADVLTFYQERIANESYLRTATERSSVLELARAIGYELAPGVAAETVLAFTLETAEGAPGVVPIGTGTKVQSNPGPDEKPQTFETVEAIEARGEWNELRPRLTEPVLPAVGQTEAHLAGVDLNLAPGDALLLVDPEASAPPRDQWALRFLDDVEPDHERGVTRVTWRLGLGIELIDIDIDIDLDPFDPTDPFEPPELPEPPETPPLLGGEFHALRTKAALFGSAAPDWRLLTDTVRDRYDPTGAAKDADEWPGLTVTAISGEDQAIHLDGLHREILPGSRLVLVRPGSEQVYEVLAVEESARKGFGLTGKTTRVLLGGAELSPFDAHVRETVVYAQSELLDRAERPIAGDVGGAEIELDRLVTPLPVGRLVVVSGEPADGGPAVSEQAVVTATETVANSRTLLVLEGELARPYRRDSVQIAANVIRATHGEGVQEPLGSGDAAKPFQTFVLRQSPVTHVFADTPTGRRSTIELRVDGVLWEEVPSLFGRGPSERVYILRIDDDAKATARFGDGRTGTRLPTGPENVSAAYRKGIGVAGNLDAGKLTLPLTRPLGVRGVTNLLPATGGTDPEVLADARANAPLTVLTLGRIVSLDDYADFARAFEGVAKAHATWVWGDDGKAVFVTVAGTNGDAVPEDGPVQRSLLDAMATAGDAHVGVTVRSYEAVGFRVGGTIERDPVLLAEQVLADAEAALAEHFAFTARAFGQPVPLSELLAVLHGVAGVVAVDLDALYTGSVPALNRALVARVPVPGDDVAAALPAQLLTIDLRAGDLKVTP